MIIAICILSALLLCAIWIIICLWHAINKIMDNNPKLAVDYYLNKESIEKYKCTLLLTENENAEFDGSVYDFSQYEEKNIIGLIEYKKETTKHNNEDEPQIALIPGQTIYKMKDGSYQWDFRGLM